MNSQNRFCIDTKWMQNFVKKSNFVQQHETVAQENLLFNGNLYQSKFLYVQLEYKINYKDI